MPIRLICSTGGLHCLRSATTSFWHNRCRRGPSTPSLLAGAALVVEGNDILGRPRHVGHKEADARIEFAQMPFDFGDDAARLCPASRPIGEICVATPHLVGGLPIGRVSRWAILYCGMRFAGSRIANLIRSASRNS